MNIGKILQSLPLLAGLAPVAGLPAYAQQAGHPAAHRHDAPVTRRAGNDAESADGSHAHHERTPPAMAEGMPGHSMEDHPDRESVIRTPIPTVTDADRAAAFPALNPHAMEHGPAIHYLVQIDRLEIWDASAGMGQAWEGRAWVGGDLHRLWLRSEGERIGGRTESSELEAFYGRSVTPWWDALIGVRQDFLPFKPQTWAAVGVQGMAPYKFEIAATAYFGESGHIAARIEAEYVLLLTDRLMLQPSIEAAMSLRQDSHRQLDNGLNTFEAGLRLRYEITRRFAPYIGIVHERRFGAVPDPNDAAAAEHRRDMRWVAGVRVWF